MDEQYEPREVRLARYAEEVRAGLAMLLAPPERPEAELLTAFRVKSGMEGHPKTCPKRICRRAHLCHAGDIEAGAPCGRNFTPAQTRDFENMALGILLVWRLAHGRAEQERGMIDRWSASGRTPAPLPRAKPSRKQKT